MSALSLDGFSAGASRWSAPEASIGTVIVAIMVVFLGTALGNKGIQPLLDAVTRHLPSPVEHEVTATPFDDPTTKIQLSPDRALPLVAMAFKIVDDPFGQLTFMRIYQGEIRKGELYFIMEPTETDNIFMMV